MLRKVLTLTLIGLILVMADRAFAIGNIRSKLHIISNPVMKNLTEIGIRIQQTAQFVISLPKVYQDNGKLKDGIDNLTSQVLEIDRLKDENLALRNQLNVLGKRSVPKVMAYVVGSEIVANSVVINVDKGKNDGITEGSIAVYGSKLIGRVIKVTDTNAMILPVFAVSSKVPVRIIRDNNEALAGIVIGQFNSQLKLTEVSHSQILQKGDLLVSSGEGGVYSIGLYVGRVNEITSDVTNVFQEASVEPVWQLNDLMSLFIEIK